MNSEQYRKMIIEGGNSDGNDHQAQCGDATEDGNPAECSGVGRNNGAAKESCAAQNDCVHNDGCVAGKLVIFSAPSGAGKTTIVRAMMERFPAMEFSVSATSRPPRCGETNGRDYYFFTAEEFEKAVEDDLFVEWEEVYAGTRYGTLRSEVRRLWTEGKVVLFDVDVKGGLRLKSIFASRALAIFVMPPSIEALRQRLESRGTESPETIGKRVGKAEEEISYADRFDRVVVNDDLGRAILEVENIIAEFLSI